MEWRTDADYEAGAGYYEHYESSRLYFTHCPEAGEDLRSSPNAQ
jgi:hypothetical protein